MMVIKNAFVVMGRVKPYVLINFHVAHSTLLQETINIHKTSGAPS